MDYTGTVVVIPTRNRATMVTDAICSVLDQPAENVTVMVSDNSTSETDRSALASFCSTYSENRLRYIRPPRSLSMPAHWDWAISEALQLYPASHFLYLTDRMMFRRGALGEVIKLAARFPDKVISYNHDRIVDNVKPIRIEQYPASGKLLEVETVHLSWLLSQAVIHPAVPRMLNCIAPSSILNRIRGWFGNVFSSISPDFNFCCRCLELEESILFYDKSPIFHYALSRSNGYSATRGEMSTDYADFTASLPTDRSTTNFATPIEQLRNAINYAFHEYCLFKQQTNSPKFFDLDMQNYLQANAKELSEIIDPTIREQMLSLLVANGYSEKQTNGEANATMISLPARARAKLKRLLTGRATTPVWLFLARTLAITPPSQNQFAFANLDDAIDYAKNISLGNIMETQSSANLLNAREIPTR